MKRILLACSLFVAFCAGSFAQVVSSHPTPTPVSKTVFTAKVAELNALIEANNIPAANAKWNEISEQANNELIVVRYKMQDAMDIHNDVDKAHYADLGKSQRMLFAQALQLKADMPANKTVINEKLTAFANAII